MQRHRRMTVAAEHVHGFNHAAMPRQRTDHTIGATGADTNLRPTVGEATESAERFMHMPYRRAAGAVRPLFNQRVVCGFIALDYVRNDRPSRLRQPGFAPVIEFWPIGRPLLCPRAESAVVEHDSAADF